MNNRIDKIFFSFVIIYLVIGIILSITTGISYDESHEQNTWEINLKAIKSFFIDNNGYEELLKYKDRYFGIAFHLLSQPIQFLSYKFVADINSMTDNTAYLVSRHISFFSIFTVSGIFFYKLCFKISNNYYFSILSSVIYLLYPYLIGHAFMNTKDIPLLSFWLICTYFSLSVFERYLNKKNFILSNVILLSFLTAFLVSIRSVGLIIFIQYLISILVLINIKKLNFFDFVKKNLNPLLIFFTSFFLFIYILNPIFWKNPYEFINSIMWFVKYAETATCTLTLGDCMKSLNLNYKYYFIWLFFKLPAFIIIGALVFPLVENKLFLNDKTKLYYSSILISFISIILIFILKKVAIYDEIRHIMFVIPLLFIISLFNLFKFNEKIFYIVSFVLISIFLIENIKLNPYQYTWLNHFARLTNIQKNFELDYWGISSKNLQKEIIKISDNENLDKSICTFGPIYNGAYMKKSGFNCFKIYSSIDDPNPRPFFAIQNSRNLKRSNPKDCELKYVEKYKYPFFNQELIMGKVWFCN